MLTPLHTDILKRLESLGIDRDAVAWIVKAAHPAVAADSPGMPDESYVATVRPEYRIQHVVSSPVALATPTWDLCIWKPPGDVQALRWATR